MDLVEMTGDGDDNPRQLVMSPAAKALARIATQPVRRKNVTRPVRMVGKVDYDETAIRTISAWVAGRIDHLRLTRVSPLSAPMFLEMGRVPVKGAAEEKLLAEEAARLMESAGLAQITPPPSDTPKWRVGW